MASFLEYIEHWANHTADIPALVSPQGTATYRELWNQVRSLKSTIELIDNNIISIHEDEAHYWYVSEFLAGLEAGLQVFPMPPGLKPRTLDDLYNRIVLDPYHSPQSREVGSVLHLTSGSTGAQRVVVRSLENLIAEALSVADMLNLSTGRRVLVTTPLSHSFGCGMMRAVLISGATLYTAFSSNPHLRFTTIRKYLKDGVDIVTGVPYVFQTLLRHWPIPFTINNTMCYSGGEPVPSKLCRDWLYITDSYLKQEYGLSEGGIATFASKDSSDLSIGKALPGVAIKLARDGELVIYREGNPTQYYFYESPETFLHDGGVNTGDIGYILNGEYYLTGRKKSVIIVAGMKLVPYEVEDRICQVPGVEESVVLAVPDSMTGERPHAFVLCLDTTVSKELLVRYLHTQLESYKVPKGFTFLREWPRTVSGKIDRQSLKEML